MPEFRVTTLRKPKQITLVSILRTEDYPSTTYSPWTFSPSAQYELCPLGSLRQAPQRRESFSNERWLRRGTKLRGCTQTNSILGRALDHEVEVIHVCSGLEGSVLSHPEQRGLTEPRLGSFQLIRKTGSPRCECKLLTTDQAMWGTLRYSFSQEFHIGKEPTENIALILSRQPKNLFIVCNAPPRKLVDSATVPLW